VRRDQGGALVNDDDPAPRVTVEPVADRVAEGGKLTWRVRLSTMAETPVWVDGVVEPPAAGTELSSTDVDPTWFTETSGEDPLPSRPLSETGLPLGAGVPPAELTADLTIPTVADGETEPDEVVRLRLVLGGEDPPELGTVTGTVTD
jgi:hypothetical protein